MNEFKEATGDFPSSYEFDNHNNKPCSIRTIERHFGGYPEFKKNMGIELFDDRVGERRGEVASISMANSLDAENEFYLYLLELYTKEMVHRWEHYGGDKQRRADFGVYAEKGHYFVDIFWAGNVRTAMGCVNIKQNKIPPTVADPVFLVCTNEDIDKTAFYNKVKNKKKDLPSNVVVLTVSDFKAKIAAGDF